MTSRMSWWALVAVAALYVLVPGHPQLPLDGMPIGQTGIVILVALFGLAAWTRHQATAVSPKAVILLAALVAAKLAIATVTPAAGWLGHYYANEDFEPPVERSIDFRGLAATRIDPELSFFETGFPVHFYNDRKYNTGVYREWTLPFSVSWIGHVDAATPASTVVRLTANGRAEVLVDGVRRLEVASEAKATATAEATVDLPAGPHVIEVRYRKPAETAALLRFERADGVRSAAVVSDGAVTPWPVPARARAVMGPAAIAGWVIHATTLAVTLAGLWPSLRRRLRQVLSTGQAAPIAAADMMVPVLVVGLLMAQGLWKARHLVGHVWTLSGGDDWLNYEMAARDAVLNGLMMSEGGVIGRGQPFSLYPGYGYFVALVHAVTGESLAGVVLVNFLLLAAATLVAYYLGRRLLGPVAALGGLAWLLAIEQADFVRYYTVTLFSENLYFVLVAVTLWFLVRHLQQGGWRPLIGAALAGAMASLTRPSMMLLLPAAIGLIVVARVRADGAVRAMLGAGAFAAVWMVALSPVTLRNYWMSGRAVLITAGQAVTFIVYNIPVNDPKYFKSFDGSLFNGGLVLLWMLYEHPMASLANYGTKLGFSLGMVHWMGSGTMHPELILTTVLYLAGIAMFPGLRTLPALAIHAFILSHVATMMLTMPSNYGYRMILPPFVFMAVVAGAVAVMPLHRMATARWPILGRVPPETAP